MNTPQSDARRDAATAWLPSLESERLIIRPLAVEDLEDCHKLFVGIGWTDVTVSDETNKERRRSWLDWTIAGYREFARLHQPQYGERAIVAKASGAFLGLIGMVPALEPFAQLPCDGARKGARWNAEVGLFWALLPSEQGKGLVTEAAALFARDLFERLKLKRLIATTTRDNVRSIAVMRRIGMRIEENPFVEPKHFQVVGVLEAPA